MSVWRSRCRLLEDLLSSFLSIFILILFNFLDRYLCSSNITFDVCIALHAFPFFGALGVVVHRKLAASRHEHEYPFLFVSSVTLLFFPFFAAVCFPCASASSPTLQLDTPWSPSSDFAWAAKVGASQVHQARILVATHVSAYEHHYWKSSCGYVNTGVNVPPMRACV